MTRRRTGVALAAVLASAALTAACSGSDPSPAPTSPTAPSSTSSPGTSTSSPGGGLPAGGTSAAPVVLNPATDLLNWTPVGGASTATVTRTRHGSLSVDRSAGTVTITDARGSYDLAAPDGFRFSDVLTDGTRAVVVAQDKTEQQPSRATIVTLADRHEQRLDAASTPPTVNGGSWAIRGDRLYHATYRGASYCLASVTLPGLTGQTTYCAPARAGFSQVDISPAGTSLLTFGGRPQCRTPAMLSGSSIVALPGVARCAGWDSLLTPGGAIWSSVPNPNRVEAGHFYARAGTAYYDLGLGSTGSLVWCGGSAYFTRDAQRDRDKARVLRWSPSSGLSVVYQSPGLGQAFMTDPRCAGDVLTVSEFGEGGDQQVWAVAP